MVVVSVLCASKLLTCGTWQVSAAACPQLTLALAFNTYVVWLVSFLFLYSITIQAVPKTRVCAHCNTAALIVPTHRWGIRCTIGDTYISNTGAGAAVQQPACNTMLRSISTLIYSTVQLQ